jgi:hypothetical protein
MPRSIEEWLAKFVLMKTIASAVEPARGFALRFSGSMRKKENQR